MAALSSRARAAPCPRMCGVVDAGQMRKIEVGIDLRGADVGVTQQFLHAAQIGAGLEQMSCKRMTKHMRVDMQRRSLAARPRRRRAAARPAPTIDGRFCRRTKGWRARRRAAMICPVSPSAARPVAPATCFNAPMAWRPMGTMRALLPLPSTRTVRSVRSIAASVQAHEFGQAQSRRIEQFHDGLVARGQGIVDPKRPAAGPFDRRPGCAAGASWFSARVHLQRDCAPPRPRASGIRKTFAPPTGAAGCCAGSSLPACWAAAKARICGMIEAVPARPSLRARAEFGQREQIVPIGGNGVAAHAPFVREVRLKIDRSMRARPSPRRTLQRIRA